jgi:transcriptional regulator with XRE-family HTH domain
MEHKILRQFGSRVKKLRKARGWSQEELGKRAGLHRTYIGSIERSERNISLLNIERIAKALDVNLKNLIG